MEELSEKLNRYFPGKVVRKDLTKKIKEGANVPVYVLEYLLGMYCATDDEKAIEDGVEQVKNILADNFVRPDEAEKVKSKIKETKHEEFNINVYEDEYTSKVLKVNVIEYEGTEYN